MLQITEEKPKTISDRAPGNFFTPAREGFLEDIVGELSHEEMMWVGLVGEYSAKELWPKDKYDAINNPNNGRDMSRPLSVENGHEAFKQAIDSLIDPDKIAFRGAFLPKELGGAGFSYPVYMMGLEMITQGNASVGISLVIDGSTLDAVRLANNEAQIQRYVVDAMQNRQMLAFAQTEPGFGSDSPHVKSSIGYSGGRAYLKGQKNWITNGGWAEYYFMVVRTNPKEKGKEGLSILMVHKDEIPEIKLMEKSTVPGSFTAELFLDGGTLKLGDLLPRVVGEFNRGFYAATNLLSRGRVTYAAFALGIGQEALEDAVHYAKQRPINGGYIIDFKDRRSEIAKLTSDLMSARDSTYITAQIMQKGRDLRLRPSVAKLQASDAAMRLAQANVMIHGAYGLSRDRAKRLEDDAKVGVIGEGHNHVQIDKIGSAIKKGQIY